MLVLANQKFVYEDNEKSAEALTYESAWDEKTQGNAAHRHIRGELFHDDMKGGICRRRGRATEIRSKAGTEEEAGTDGSA